MPGEYLYVVGEREELGADGVDELVVFSAQIGATDAFGKEGIAGKEHFFVGFVEANAAGRVTRRVQHAEGVVAEGEFRRAAGGADGLEACGDSKIGATAQKVFGVARGMCQKRFVGRVHARGEPVGFGRPCAAKHVIKVPVCE